VTNVAVRLHVDPEKDRALAFLLDLKAIAESAINLGKTSDEAERAFERLAKALPDEPTPAESGS
jgi:hypothetical protein